MSLADTKLASGNFQVLEAFLSASVFGEHGEQLIERLRFMCDPEYRDFEEHEMIFVMKDKINNTIGAQIQLRRYFTSDATMWHVRYLATPIADKSSAVIRSSINSIVKSSDIMSLLKMLNFTIKYEYVTRGMIFTRGPIKILIYKIFETMPKKSYSRANLVPFSNDYVIEASIVIENDDTATYANRLKSFCDQFAPLIQFKKVEYFRPPKKTV